MWYHSPSLGPMLDARDPVWSMLVGMPDTKRDALRTRVTSIDPAYAIRGALLGLIRPALAAQCPGALTVWDDFARARPTSSMFGFSSAREMLLQLAFAGQLYRPDATLDEGGNALAATGSDLIWEVHVMRPIVRACENSLHRLLEVYARSARLLVNRGSMHYQRCSAHEVAIYCEDIPSEAFAMVAPGFWQALASRFVDDVRVEYHIYAPTRSEIHLRW